MSKKGAGGNPSAGHDRDSRKPEPKLKPTIPKERRGVQRTGHAETGPEGKAW